MIHTANFFRHRSIPLLLAASLLAFSGCQIGLHIEGLYPDDAGDGGSDDFGRGQTG